MELDTHFFIVEVLVLDSRVLIFLFFLRLGEIFHIRILCVLLLLILLYLRVIFCFQ